MGVHGACSASSRPVNGSTRWVMEKLRKFVSIRIWYGGRREALCWKKREVGGCGLFLSLSRYSISFVREGKRSEGREGRKKREENIS